MLKLVVVTSVNSTLCLTELVVASPDALMRKCRQQAPQAATAIVITPVEQQRKRSDKSGSAGSG